REEAIGDVDRDALLALGGEAVHQQREIDILPLRADALAVGLERGKLVLEDHLAVVEQPPDQRGFAVVDAAAGDEPQQALVLVQLEIGLDVLGDEGVRDIGPLPFRGEGWERGRIGEPGICNFPSPRPSPLKGRGRIGVSHQKYPSCFFFSMPAPPASLSIARPWRSLVVVSSISCTTSASVAASLSIAPVSG